MTDYESMTASRDLDALVAERVFGCSVRWEIDLYGRNCRCGCKKIQRNNRIVAPHGLVDHEGVVHEELPRYSHDIEAAWEVVEKLFISTTPAPLAICRIALKAMGRSLTWERKAPYVAIELEELKAQIASKDAEAAAMREALEAWASFYNPKKSGPFVFHLSKPADYNVVLQMHRAALALNSGRALLGKLRRLTQLITEMESAHADLRYKDHAAFRHYVVELLRDA